MQVTEITNWGVDLIDVRKAYGSVHALRGVNIQVGRGEIFGLLGPNGAGKSTLVKIMMTVVKPDHAVGTVLGRPLGNRKKLARIGYLPEGLPLPGYLTARQALHFFGAMSLVPANDRRQRADRLLSQVGMGNWADARLSKFSKGMQRRLGIAQALINDPDLIVLDEPTDGLDPVGRREVRTLLQELRQQGKTIFLNSHLLSELEMLCDRVAILADGMVARQGTLEELTEHTIEYRIQVTKPPTELAGKIQAIDGVVDGRTVIVRGHDVTRLNDMIDLLRSQKVSIEAVEPHRFSLEDVFVEVLGYPEAGTGGPPTARPIRTGH